MILTYITNAFKKLVIYFQENYNLTLDESGSDTTRLCFLSYDPAIRIKIKFKAFEINIVDIKEHETVNSVKDKQKILSEITLKTTKKKNSLFNPSGKNNPKDRKTIYSIITYLTKRKISITGSYEETAEFYARIYWDLKKKGKPVPSNDLWVASSAMRHRLALFTYDEHFDNIDGLILHKEDL
jgi:hypothetical protein